MNGNFSVNSTCFVFSCPSVFTNPDIDQECTIGNFQKFKLECIQVGDQLDRGDQEIRILYFLERLQREAQNAGGAVYVMNGNHETMNMAGRFRYSTQGIHAGAPSE